MKKHKWIAAACVLLAVAAIAMGVILFLQKEKARREYNEYCEARIDSEKQWILKNRTPDGAILTFYSQEKDSTDEKRYMNPYFACIAARGLLRGEATEEEIAAVKEYLSWYAARIEEDGSISDYDYVRQQTGDFRWQARQDADSVDSYAALFLILAAEYEETTGDTAFLSEISEPIIRVTNKLLDLQQPNGLMAVSDKNPVQYTMDNAEVNLALRKMAVLCQKNPEFAGALPRLKDALQYQTTAISTLLWDHAAGEYLVGLDGQGKALRVEDSTKIYPYWSAQLFLQLFEFVGDGAERGYTLYERFCAEIPWTDLGFRRNASSSYWCALLCCAAQNKDGVRAREYLAAYDSTLGQGRAYPYYCAESGWMILALEYMKY